MMKKYVLMIALLATVFSFSACSDDDKKEENVDVSQLEGTWGMIHRQGYVNDDGVKRTWDESYDLSNLSDGTEKIEISKDGGTVYSIAFFNYMDGKWTMDIEEKVSIDGVHVTFIGDQGGSIIGKLLVANSEQLIIELKSKDGDELYDKRTFQRM